MIYTKTGDNGTTSLVGGTRVLKCDDRVEAYGTVDELNSQLGLLAEFIRQDESVYFNFLKQVQRNLFIVQTLLATEKEVPYELPKLSDSALTDLERSIDHIQKFLPKFQHFIIPGGNVASTQCHVCRTVCRRAERCIVRLAQGQPVPEEVLRYMNRLSDFLFVLSRHLVVSSGQKESFFE